MKKILAVVSIIFFTYLVFSIRIENKPIFTHLFNKTSTITDSLQVNSQKVAKKVGIETKKYSTLIFTNSTPREIKDQVNSKLSSAKLKGQNVAEEIKEQEKKELDDLIKEF
jgi:hypothetical protein